MFPISHCVPTKLLSQKQYDWLLTKLVSEGYHLTSSLDKTGFYDLWRYIGVTDYGDIHLFDNSHSYLKANEWLTSGYIKDYNVLSEDSLFNYLQEK